MREKNADLTVTWRNALVMAGQFHGDQIRKDIEARPIPYLAHVPEVAAIKCA